MSVYFIHAGRYFKIGYSEDPERRCARLHFGTTRYTFPADVPFSPGARSLYRVVEGTKDTEREIHLALDDFAVGLEWYLDEPAVREFIDSLPARADRRKSFRKVKRAGGWCEAEYEATQRGRGERETARFQARRRRAVAS